MTARKRSPSDETFSEQTDAGANWWNKSDWEASGKAKVIREGYQAAAG